MTTPGPWDEYSKKYNISPESTAFTDWMVKCGAKPFHMCTVDEVRGLIERLADDCGGKVDYDGEVKEVIVPSPSNSKGVPVSIYKPKKLAGKPAILVFIIGGGFLVFDRSNFDSAMKIIARDSGCIVVSVQTRLWPDQGKGAAAFDDALEATKWVVANKTTIGGKPDSKVGIAGDGTGGQIAISVTNDVKELSFQILVYPNADTTLKQPSVKEFENAPALSQKDLDWFMAHINRELPNHETNPRFNPMARTNLSSAPPALIILAQIDPLRDSGVAFGAKLKAAGVKVTTVVIEGVPHLFFAFCGHFKNKCKEAHSHVVKFISQFQ